VTRLERLAFAAFLEGLADFYRAEMNKLTTRLDAQPNVRYIHE
jgi:hypothetical protein